MADHSEIREIDINPLLADERGCIALDARMRITDAVVSPRQPMAIRPYPVEWEANAELSGIGRIRLRPIRPEDETLYSRFFEKVSRDDMRMRFFTAGPDLSHNLLARFTQIDYAREMAFVAIGAENHELKGVARFVADPDYSRAEFGVLVRSDLKGHGLGWRLMQHLISFARSERLGELHGQVLTTNTTMLKMCSELGFSLVADATDATLCFVRLKIVPAKLLAVGVERGPAI